VNGQTKDTSRLLGFWMCTALVIGNIIGSGIFFLPASLAPYGLSNATSAWLFTGSGAVILAFVFAGLSRGLPGAAGPYAYTRMAFGELPAFLVAWGYWIGVWAGNAAIATGGVSYLSDLFPVIGQRPGLAPMVTLSVIWLLTAVNILGARTAGGVQIVTTVMKLIPLIVIAGIGLFMLFGGDARIASAAHAAVPVSLGAFTAAATLTLWPLLGFESASVAAERVRDPSRVIPRATIIGAALAAVIYIVASTAVQVLIPAEELAKSNAPFADVARLFFGDAVGHWLALFAVISAFGALNGWILLQGELPFQLARDGVFPRFFASESHYRTPARALYLSSALVTGLVMLNYDKSMVQIFNFVILISSFSSLVLYFVCALAVLKLLSEGKLMIARTRTAGLAICGVLGGGYALWAMVGAGISTDAQLCGNELICWAPWAKNPVYLGSALIALGLPVYFAMRWRGRVPAPQAR
jgi:APA family basic amino acid/polyamine antiporter